eukprot:3558424-Amphidinium_carterae.1
MQVRLQVGYSALSLDASNPLCLLWRLNASVGLPADSMARAEQNNPECIQSDNDDYLYVTVRVCNDDHSTKIMTSLMEVTTTTATTTTTTTIKTTTPTTTTGKNDKITS